MVLSTVLALLVTLLALLPGGVHTWFFERANSRTEHGSADRAAKILATSAVYLVLYAAAFPIFRAIGTSAARGSTAAPHQYLLAVLLLILVPAVVGSLAGRTVGRRNERGLRGRIGRLIGGPRYAPGAWDHLFNTEGLAGTIRVTLDEGTIIVGAWGTRDDWGQPGNPPRDGYAAGYPSDHQDLYISQVLQVSTPGDTGWVDDPAAEGAAMYVRAEAIRTVTFYPVSDGAKEEL